MFNAWRRERAPRAPPDARGGVWGVMRGSPWREGGGEANARGIDGVQWIHWRKYVR